MPRPPAVSAARGSTRSKDIPNLCANRHGSQGNDQSWRENARVSTRKNRQRDDDGGHSSLRALARTTARSSGSSFEVDARFGRYVERRRHVFSSVLQGQHSDCFLFAGILRSRRMLGRFLRHRCARASANVSPVSRMVLGVLGHARGQRPDSATPLVRENRAGPPCAAAKQHNPHERVVGACHAADSLRRRLA